MQATKKPLTVFAVTALLLPTGVLADSFCDGETTPIHQIQGHQDRSELVGRTVRVKGLVSGVYQGENSLKGFFLITPTSEQDNQPETSEGIFIYNMTPVAVGQSVMVSGQVTEYYGLTELSKVSQVRVCDTHQTLPPVVPLSSLQQVPGWQERVESMPVQTSTLWITGNSTLSRFGELDTATDNLFEHATGPTAPTQPYSHWVIDDGSPGSASLWATYTDADSVRLGARIEPFTAIVSYAYGQYRLLPQSRIQSQPNRPIAAPVSPFPLEATTSIAQLNVRNLFNGDGLGQGFPTARGAKTATEFQQQLAKLALTLNQLNADIIAVSELENDGFDSTSAVADLVRAINQQRDASDHYQMVTAKEGDSGDDLITQGLLYKPRLWRLERAAFLPLHSKDVSARPALSGTFLNADSGKRLQVVVVHYKSRRAGCSEDPKAEPPAGFCFQRREMMSRNLLQQLADNAQDKPDLMVVSGDFNAYMGEPALTLLTDSGWVDTRQHLNQTDAYTYVYRNQPGALDHFFVRSTAPSLPDMHQVDWHINAAESDVVVADEAKTGRLTVYRSSDHDPSMLYFNW